MEKQCMQVFTVFACVGCVYYGKAMYAGVYCVCLCRLCRLCLQVFTYLQFTAKKQCMQVFFRVVGAWVDNCYLCVYSYWKLETNSL